MDCSEIEVKVATKTCERFKYEVAEDGQRRRVPGFQYEEFGNKPDCHVNVDWS